MAPIVLAPWAEPVPGQTAQLSALDLARLADDGWTYELVEGRLVRMPLAGTQHGGISMSLGAPLAVFVRQRHLGRVFAAETGFLLSRPGDPETVLGADVAFVGAQRLPATPPEQAFWRVTPDLIAETASPGQFRPEVAAKIGLRLYKIGMPWPLEPQGVREFAVGLEEIMIVEERRGSFNPARLANLGARRAKGEYLVFLSEDTEVLKQDWIEQLLLFAEMPGVGAVGPALTHPDGQVAAAGIAIGLYDPAVPAMRGFPADGDGYYGSLSCAREVSAMTLSCGITPDERTLRRKMSA